MFVTRQAPISMLTRISYPLDGGKFLTAANAQQLEQSIDEHVDMKVTFKLQARLNREPLRQDVPLKNAGLHALLPAIASNASMELSRAYLTLQFIDAIGVFDMHRLTLVDIHCIPCSKFGLSFVHEGDADPYGLDIADCAGPHTLTEDSHGNIYITFKTAGGIGVLHDPLWCVGDECWEYFPIPRDPQKPVPFYIAHAGGSGHVEHIYYNDIANSQFGFFHVPATNWPPTSPSNFQIQYGSQGLRPWRHLGTFEWCSFIRLIQYHRLSRVRL